MLALQRYQYCFVAGCFAAGGSFFGKMPSILKEHNIDAVLGLHTLPDGIQYYGEFLLMKFIPITIMILCNVLNWRYFLKALQMSEQTLTATVLTSASNYVVSLAFYTKSPLLCNPRWEHPLLSWVYTFYVMMVAHPQSYLRRK